MSEGNKFGPATNRKVSASQLPPWITPDANAFSSFLHSRAQSYSERDVGHFFLLRNTYIFFRVLWLAVVHLSEACDPKAPGINVRSDKSIFMSPVSLSLAFGSQLWLKRVQWMGAARVRRCLRFTSLFYRLREICKFVTKKKYCCKILVKYFWHFISFSSLPLSWYFCHLSACSVPLFCHCVAI